MADTERRIRKFMYDNFFVADENLGGSLSLTDSGTIDSTGVLELVVFLEETFGISIPDSDVVPDNLDTIDNLVRYVRASRVDG